MRKLRLFSVLMAMALVLALSISNAQDYKVLNYSFGPGDIPSLDPSLSTDTSSIQIVTAIAPGLTALHETTLAVEPAMSAGWEVSEDGLTYTFSLLQEVPWVYYDMDAEAVMQATDEAGNVRYVTASDFVYGIRRSLDPRTGSYYGGVLSSWVQGGSELFTGLDDVAEDASDEEVEAILAPLFDGLMVTAVDEYTLEIVATEPAAFLTNIYGMWMASAQPQWVIEEYGELWTEAEYIQSYGPFALKEWLHNESITMIKNPFWVGTEYMPAPQLDEVYATMLEASAQLANFEAGTLDVSEVPLSDIDRVKADPTLSTQYVVGPGTCTYLYIFNTARAPFDDVRVRQAFSMAVNRQDLIDNVLKAGQEPAFFFTRPNLVAAPTAAAYPEYVIGEDDAAARALVDAYIADNGAMPTVVLMHNESEGHARIAAAIQQMWADTLGVSDIQVQTQEWAVYLETIKSDETAPPVFRYAWCLDYPDTHNFLFDVFHSSVRELGNSYNNPEVDALMEEAKREPDLARRTDLYAQVEYIMSTRDAVYIPIYFYTSSSLTQPNIERTYSQTGHQRFEKWDKS